MDRIQPGQRERLAKPPSRRFVVAGVSVEHPVEAQHLGQVPLERFSASLSVCSRMAISGVSERIWLLAAGRGTALGPARRLTGRDHTTTGQATPL